MFFLRGDVHGDFQELYSNKIINGYELTNQDYLIVCGDFGIWNNSKQENFWLDILDELPFTILFVDGNHENYDILNSFPIEQWNGGNVHFIRHNIIHLMRGQIFNIDGYKFFSMGGASSHDIRDGILELTDPLLKAKIIQLRRKNGLFRINKLSWWKEELPSEQEINHARKVLQSTNWDVDVILTHCAPDSITKQFGSTYESDRLTNFFEEVKQNASYKVWAFGHYHATCIFESKHYCLYNKPILLDHILNDKHFQNKC